MFLTDTRTSLLLSVSLLRPTFLLSKPSFPFLNLHTAPETHPLCNSYTHLLRSHLSFSSIEQVHARIVVEGSSSNSFWATHLVKSYAKLGNIQFAECVFESVPRKSVFLFNAIIRAYSILEHWFEIANLYREMEEEGVQPDSFTLPFVIKALSSLSLFEDAKRVREMADQVGLMSNVYVSTALIDMYLKTGEMDLAREVFDKMHERDVVAWTTMITGYTRSGGYKEALLVFREMQLGDAKPNWVTVLAIIPACGYSVHGFIIKSGFDFSVEVETTIFDMYAKGGDMVTARSVFDQMPQKSLISWTAMICGYSQNKHGHEAILVFHEMLEFSDSKPDSIVATTVLQACAQLGFVKCGQMLHGFVVKTGLEAKLLVETALIDMYAKCGSISAAEQVFNGIQDRSIVTWSTMIAGYGFHGFGLKALNIFYEMKSLGFVPDQTSFLSVLSACSHSGLVQEGKKCFDLMHQMNGLTPTTKHYACMIDLLGRARLLDDARDLIEGMPIEPDVNVWGALLSASRVKGDVGVAEFAYGKLNELDPDNADSHVLLAHVYAGCKRWDEVSKVRTVMRRKGEGKTPGWSFIEVNYNTHTFLAEDRSHPEATNIYAILEMLHAIASDEQVCN